MVCMLKKNGSFFPLRYRTPPCAERSRSLSLVSLWLSVDAFSEETHDVTGTVLSSASGAATALASLVRIIFRDACVARTATRRRLADDRIRTRSTRAQDRESARIARCLSLEGHRGTGVVRGQGQAPALARAELPGRGPHREHQDPRAHA